MDKPLYFDEMLTNDLNELLTEYQNSLRDGIEILDDFEFQELLNEISNRKLQLANYNHRQSQVTK